MKDKLIVEGKKETLVIPYKNILYLKAEGRYTKIITEEREKMICRHLKTFEEQLEHSPFFRVSKSYIVNTRKIKKISGNKIQVDHIEISVSRDKIKVLKNKLS